MRADDGQLLAQWVDQRDEEAFKTLAARYSGMVYNTCLRVSHNAADAEEAFQETFEALATAGTKPAPMLGPWLHRVATYRALKLIRTNQRRQERENVYANSNPALQETVWNELSHVIDTAIAQLPDSLRVPIVHHFLENQTHAEIASKLGKSRQTVTHRIEKGLKLLSKNLRKRGIEVSAVALSTMLAAKLAEAAVPVSTMATLAKLAATAAGAGTKAGLAAAGTGPAVAALLSTKVALTAGVVGASLLTLCLFSNPFSVTTNDEADRTKPAVTVPSPASKTAAPTPAQPIRRTRAAKMGEYLKMMAGAGMMAVGDGKNAAPADDTTWKGTVSGRVYDAETGQSISGATLELWPSMRPDYEKYIQCTTSDADGTYTLAGLAPGKYTIAPHKSGYGIRNRDWESAEISTDEKITGIDFALHEGLVVSGIVVDEFNHPVEDACVYAWQNECPIKETTSGNGGTFFLDDCVPNESAYLTAAKDDLSTEPGTPVVPSGNGAKEARLKLLRTGSISGVVVDLSGKPIGGAVVEGEPETPPYDMYLLTRCDEQGQFQFTNVPARAYMIGAKEPLHPDVVETTVLDNGILTEVTTEAMLADEMDERPVKCQMRVTVTPGADLGVLQIVLGGTDLSISGTVTSDNGAPISHAFVSAYGTNQDAGDAYTDEKGKYLIEGLSDRDYQLSITYKELKLPFPSLVAAGTSDADFVFPSPCSIEGTVISSATGKPVERFQVTWQRPSQAGADVEQITEAGLHVLDPSSSRDVEDPAGAFMLDSFEPGTVTLIVGAAGYATASVPLDLEPGQKVQNVIVPLENCAPIRGIVVDEDGKPVQGVHVVEEAAASDIWSATTKADGSFELTSYSPEVSAIDANLENYSSARVEIDLEQATKEPVTIVMFQGGIVEGHVYSGGRPVVGVAVMVMVTTEEDYPEGSESMTMDDGSFRVEDLPPGPAKVLVGLQSPVLTEEMAIAAANTTVVAGKTIAIDIEIPK